MERLNALNSYKAQHFYMEHIGKESIKQEPGLTVARGTLKMVKNANRVSSILTVSLITVSSRVLSLLPLLAATSLDSCCQLPF